MSGVAITIVGVVISVFLIIAEVTNIVTFQHFKWRIAGRAKLTVARKSQKMMNYFIPDVMQRTKPAFDFVGFSELEGGITFVDYLNFGFNPRNIARQIKEDILANNYNARIFTIGIGDQVARHIDGTFNDRVVNIISINPSIGMKSLQQNVRFAYVALLPMAQLVALLAGWLACFPIITASIGEKKVSMSLLTDQVRFMLYNEEQTVSQDTEGLLLSKSDEVLDNEWLYEKYKKPVRTNYAIVPTRHAEVEEKPYRIFYRDAVNELLSAL